MQNIILLGTHQLIQHNKKSDTGKIHRVSVTGDDQFADSFGLETRPPSVGANTVGRRPVEQRIGAIDNSNVGEGLGCDLIQFETNLSLD